MAPQARERFGMAASISALPLTRFHLNLARAAAGMLIFLTLLITSGRIVAGDGVGWDGCDG
jgi:hypothetical protein